MVFGMVGIRGNTVPGGLMGGTFGKRSLQQRLGVGQNACCILSRSLESQ